MSGEMLWWFLIQRRDQVNDQKFIVKIRNVGDLYMVLTSITVKEIYLNQIENR